MEKALWELLVLALFLGVEEHMPDQTVTGLPFKHTGLAIPDATLTANM